MAYNQLSLETLKQRFGLRTDEQGDYFANVEPVEVSQPLRDHLRRHVPRAIAIGTEKGRSELIITPVLVEVIDRFQPGVSLFSGVEFNADPDRGLSGVCDFLLSLSPEQLTIEAPVVAIVEAKNENIRLGLSQCVAEMIAAQVFNESRQNPLETVYGVVTTGTNWLFLRLNQSVVSIDRTEYHINQVEKIVGILVAMIRRAAEQAAQADPGNE